MDIEQWVAEAREFKRRLRDQDDARLRQRRRAFQGGRVQKLPDEAPGTELRSIAQHLPPP